MIRTTNPWIGGSTGDDDPSSPCSPDQTPPTPMRWSAADETEPPNTITARTTTTTTTRPFRNSVAKFVVVDEEFNLFNSSRSGDDSLLTTSMDTDSLFQSEISDNEAARTTSSRLDWSLAPNDNEPRATNDVTNLYANTPNSPPVEKNDSSIAPRSSGLSPLVSVFGRHKDCEGDGLSIEAAVGSEERNRKRMRRSPESSPSDWKRRPRSAEEEAEQISEFVPCCEAQATTERRSDDTQEAKSTTSNDKIHNSETQAKPKCQHQQQQRRRRLVMESGDSDFTKRHDEDPLAAASDQLRRKILAIRSSLQDKVALLKHEKKVVDRKIREAKEEERLKLRQLEYFRRQLSQTRKEILLRTLEEVKKQLGQQVLRLQNVYDFVLVEQRQLVYCY